MYSRILRADGTEISNIKSCVFNEAVNSEHNLKPGCVSSAYIDVVAYGSASDAPSEGEALRYYQVDDDDNATLIGYFYAEPAVTTKITFSFTAYDAVSKLDVDFSETLYGLGSNGSDSFPMTIKALVQQACAVAGVTLSSSSWALSTEEVQEFYTENISCRQILQWAAEIACCFVRCNTSGGLVFDWYADASDSIAPSAATNTLAYRQDGLSYEYYEVKRVGSVAVRTIGTEYEAYVYPTSVEALEDNDNALIISGNLLLTDADSTLMLAVAQNIFTVMRSLPVWRPCTVQLFPFENVFRAGDIVSVTDIQDVSFTTLFMTAQLSANDAQLSSTSDETYEDANDQIGTAKALIKMGADIVRIDKLKVGYAEIEEAVIDSLTATGIDASEIEVTNLNADNITSGTLSADRIDTASISVSDLSDGSSYSTTSEMNTAISDAIDDIGVGGRNILVNSANMTDYWQKGSLTTVSDGVALLAGSSDNWNARIDTPLFDIALFDGETDYVLSFEYRSSDSFSFLPTINATGSSVGSTGWTRTKYGYWQSTETLPAADTWTKYVLPHRTISTSQLTSGSGDAVSGYFSFYARTSDVSVYIRHVKFERGTIATDWTRAPEDVDSDIETAQTTANGAVVSTVPLYYRSTTNSTPSISTSVSIGTSASTSNAWEYVMPYPARGCYFYMCEKYIFTDGSVDFSTVRPLSNATYTSLWCSSSDATYIDGGKIYANTVTTDQLDATSINAWGTLTVGAMTSAVQNYISDGEAAYNRSVAYQGTCSTANGTAAKVVTCTNFTLATGAVVTVRFANADNSCGALTLNVNSTGAKTIYVAGAVTSSSNQLKWTAGSAITFVYTGTYWRVADQPGAWRGSTCSTTKGTAAKTSTSSGIVIFKGVSVSVPMTYENTNTSATLTVSSLGANGIRYDDGGSTSSSAPTTANHHGWIAGGVANFVFDGQYWILTGGTTIIDGDHIQTGTIDASVVDVTNLSADNITTGAITVEDSSSNVLFKADVDNNAVQIAGFTVDDDALYNGRDHGMDYDSDDGLYLANDQLVFADNSGAEQMGLASAQLLFNYYTSAIPATLDIGWRNWRSDTSTPDGYAHMTFGGDAYGLKIGSYNSVYQELLRLEYEWAALRRRLYVTPYISISGSGDPLTAGYAAASYTNLFYKDNDTCTIYQSDGSDWNTVDVNVRVNGPVMPWYGSYGNAAVMNVLWENSDTTASFAAQKLSVSNGKLADSPENYDEIRIESKWSTTSDYRKSETIGYSPGAIVQIKHDGTYTYSTTTFYSRKMYRDFTLNADSIAVSSGTFCLATITSSASTAPTITTTVSAAYAIPVRIVGIKYT